MFRKVFEPFGGIRSAFTAARDGKPVESQIEMASSEGLYISDPDYALPCVGDIELVFIAFDILFVDEEVRGWAFGCDLSDCYGVQCGVQGSLANSLVYIPSMWYGST